MMPRATQVTLCGGLAAPNTNPTFADSATSTTIPPRDPVFIPRWLPQASMTVMWNLSRAYAVRYSSKLPISEAMRRLP